MVCYSVISALTLQCWPVSPSEFPTTMHVQNPEPAIQQRNSLMHLSWYQTRVHCLCGALCLWSIQKLLEHWGNWWGWLDIWEWKSLGHYAFEQDFLCFYCTYTFTWTSFPSVLVYNQYLKLTITCCTTLFPPLQWCWGIYSSFPLIWAFPSSIDYTSALLAIVSWKQYHTLMFQIC